MKRKIISLTLTAALFITAALSNPLKQPVFGAYRSELEMPLQTKKSGKIIGDYYVPSTVNNVRWGELPNRDAKPIMTVKSGSTVTFDTVSHEGLLEDQGKNPVAYFAKYGVKKENVLEDAIKIAESSLIHDFDADGPHIVTGPVAVEGAEPGDVLKVEVIELLPRVPYGVISNRHYKGSLPEEFPENEGRVEPADPEHYENYNNVSIFTKIEERDGQWYGIISDKGKKDIVFPISPFLGIMAVAPDTSEKVNSIPPREIGGNLDINELGLGSTLYLPVQVKGALFSVSDPHFSQGDGEVALTAFEASLRGTVRLTVLKKGDPAIPMTGDKFVSPFGETQDFWIPIGLDPDLDEAMKKSVREAVGFLSNQLGISRAVAYAYLSAATDFEVSQVVDRTKGIHATIRKIDFENYIKLNLYVDKQKIPVSIIENNLYVPLKTVVKHLGGTVKGKTEQTVTLMQKKILMTPDSNVYTVGKKSVTLSVSPVLKNKTVMIPVTAVSEVLGASVTWSTVGKELKGTVVLY